MTASSGYFKESQRIGNSPERTGGYKGTLLFSFFSNSFENCGYISEFVALILLRTVIMNAKNCAENSLGSFFLLFLITTQHGYEHVWWFLRHCKRKLAPYWVTFIKITISRPRHFKSIEKPRVFFMFLFLFWNKFVKLQKFAQKNIGCNYIWGLGAGGLQHLFWPKSKELSFVFNSKTLENMQFFYQRTSKDFMV